MPDDRPLILITNDDGIDSPGLIAVASAVADLGDLLIAAPATQQTGMGRSSPAVVNGIVVQSTLEINGQAVPAYAVPGSPAQAVMYAVIGLRQKRRPVLAISGINYGENLGTVTSGSGTVGAALEAATYGIPGLAISVETPKSFHFEVNANAGVDMRVAARAARYFAQACLGRELPFDVDVLKIDVPAEATPSTPWRLTRQSRQSYYRNYPVGELPLPELGHFDYDVSIDWHGLEPGSDIKALVQDRVIAVTPLSVDLTSRTDFATLDRLLRQAELT
jgi:5'-nucleotidase